MAELRKLKNAVVLDKELISDVWYFLHRLSDPDLLNKELSDFESLQKKGQDICVALSHRMAQQECPLSDTTRAWQWVQKLETEGNNYVPE
jgi:hypothetical protein